MQLGRVAEKITISKVLLLVGLLFGPPLCANAQSGSGVNYLRSYVFVAPSLETLSGHQETGYAIGGGFEQMVWKFLGAGVDLKAVIPGSHAASNTVGIAASNMYAQHTIQPKLDLFGTGGYALLFRDFAANGYDFGGGVNYWVHENLGLSFEIREEAGAHPPVGVPNHYLEFRMGLTFR